MIEDYLNRSGRIVEIRKLDKIRSYSAGISAVSAVAAYFIGRSLFKSGLGSLSLFLTKYFGVYSAAGISLMAAIVATSKMDRIPEEKFVNTLDSMTNEEIVVLNEALKAEKAKLVEVADLLETKINAQLN